MKSTRVGLWWLVGVVAAAILTAWWIGYDVEALIDPAERKTNLEDAETGRRQVFFEIWHDTPVFWRDHLPTDFTLIGPAIIQQMDTTILIEPGDEASGDSDGNIIITIGSRA